MHLSDKCVRARACVLQDHDIFMIFMSCVIDKNNIFNIIYVNICIAYVYVIFNVTAMYHPVHYILRSMA